MRANRWRRWLLTALAALSLLLAAGGATPRSSIVVMVNLRSWKLAGGCTVARLRLLVANPGIHSLRFAAPELHIGANVYGSAVADTCGKQVTGVTVPLVLQPPASTSAATLKGTSVTIVVLRSLFVAGPRSTRGWTFSYVLPRRLCGTSGWVGVPGIGRAPVTYSCGP